MKSKNLQTYVCAISANGAKHYLAIGTTKLQRQDLESCFTDEPTPAILKALDGMQPAKLAWIELEWIGEKRFAAGGWSVSKDGVQIQENIRMSAREMRIGELADIMVDEMRRNQHE